MNCKSQLEIGFGYKRYEVVLRLSMIDYDVPKGIFMPFFTQVSFLVALASERFYIEDSVPEPSKGSNLKDKLDGQSILTKSFTASKGKMSECEESLLVVDDNLELRRLQSLRKGSLATLGQMRSSLTSAAILPGHAPVDRAHRNSVNPIQAQKWSLIDLPLVKETKKP